MPVNLCCILTACLVVVARTYAADVLINARLMLLCLPLLHTITTHNSLPHYSLSFYQQIRLICRIYILTIVISNG